MVTFSLILHYILPLTLSSLSRSLISHAHQIYTSIWFTPKFLLWQPENAQPKRLKYEITTVHGVVEIVATQILHAGADRAAMHVVGAGADVRMTDGRTDRIVQIRTVCRRHGMQREVAVALRPGQTWEGALCADGMENIHMLLLIYDQWLIDLCSCKQENSTNKVNSQVEKRRFNCWNGILIKVCNYARFLHTLWT